MTAARNQMGSNHIELPDNLKLVGGKEEVQEAPDFTQRPLEPEAFQYWNDKKASFPYHLPFDAVKAYARSIGRQLRLEEIKALVGFDGPEVSCVATGKKFDPVFWIEPMKVVKEACRQHKDVLTALANLDKHNKVLRFGHFFIVEGGLRGERKPVSGNPYFAGKEGVFPDKKSPLVKASEKNAKRLGVDSFLRWGFSNVHLDFQIKVKEEEKRKKEAQAEARRQRERTQAQKAEQKLDQLFF